MSSFFRMCIATWKEAFGNNQLFSRHAGTFGKQIYLAPMRQKKMALASSGFSKKKMGKEKKSR